MQTWSAVLLVLMVAFPAAAERSHFATKADERAGRLTPGDVPHPPGAVTAVGGDTCAAPHEFPYCLPGPFSDTGTTVGADNTVGQVNAGCSDYSTVAGPDVIYRFDYAGIIPNPPPFSALVSPAAGYDVAVYLLAASGGCPVGTGNSVTNCVMGADAQGAGGTEFVGGFQDGPLPLGIYYLFIDSFYSTGTAALPNRHQGTYSLQVGGICPVELLEFSVE
jgi:hypothetical protein